LLCMAADGLFLSVVVERHSARDLLALQCVCTERASLLDGRLLRRGGRVILGRSRHGG
jgi:hypothetical protein